MILLPNEILIKIFKHLSNRDLKNIKCTCLKFSHIANIHLFAFPRFKPKLRVSIFQLIDLPLLYVDNKFLKRFLDVRVFPVTVKEVYLSVRKPIVSPHIITKFNHIKFFASSGYFYPLNCLHSSNYTTCKNLKIYSSPHFPMRIKTVYNFLKFTFSYLNSSHLEIDSRNFLIALEEGYTALLRLKVDRLTLLKSSWLNISVEKLFRLQNLVCICSSIISDSGPFPFNLLLKIKTLEVIFLEQGVLFLIADLKNIKPFSHSPYHYQHINRGFARISTPCVICVKQPRSAFGTPFTPTGSQWRDQLLQQYSSPALPALESPHYLNY